MAKKAADGLWRRQFLGGAGVLALGGLTGTKLLGQPRPIERQAPGIWLWSMERSIRWTRPIASSRRY